MELVMSGTELTTLKVELAEIKAGLKSITKDLNEWKKIQEKFLQMEVEKVNLTLDNFRAEMRRIEQQQTSEIRGHRSSLQREDDQNRQLSKFCIGFSVSALVFSMGAFGIKIFGVVELLKTIIAGG